MRATRVWRGSGLTVLALLAGLVSPAVAHAEPAIPVAAITSPADGTGAEGTLSIQATGQLDPTAMDSAVSLSLLVDDTPVADSAVSCVGQPDPNFCTATFSYPTSGLAVGQHTLKAELTTAIEGFFDSPPVIVIVPVAPTVSIDPVTSPVTGPVAVTVTGNTDPVSSDLPKSIVLDWGGTQIGRQDCALPRQHSCPLSFDWDTTGLNDTHALTATMTTVSAGPQPPAVQASVQASNPLPTVTIDTPAPGEVQPGIVHVHATGAISGPQRDHPVSMQLFLDDTDHPVDGQLVTCATEAPTCDASFQWDSTGRTGTFDLIVVVDTFKNHPNSSSVRVQVTSPLPTLATDLPADGSTVSGLVNVAATGTVDPSQSDTGDSLELLVDGSTVDTAPCPATRSCSGTLTWDATTVNGTRQLKVVFTTAKNKTASVSRSVRATTTPPTAGIAAPGDGATVSGPITIVTTGAIAARAKDSPATMALLVDGQPVSAPQPCTAAVATPKACSTPFGWDTTGLSGAHTLQASFRTLKGFTALSSKLTITVVSPLPVATIIAPGSRATVHRTATITASGVIDATQTDVPASMQLSLDGAPLGAAIPCAAAPASPRSCSVAYHWSTVGLTGRHTLAATVVSAKGVVGTSVATSVYVFGGTKTLLTPVKARHPGRLFTYTGRVTTLVNKLGTPGVKVKVVIRPAVGKAKTLYVLTNARGYFKVAFKPAVNATVTATMLALPYYGTSHAVTKLHVVPTFTCSVGSSVRRSRLDKGSCRVAHLPRTTKVSLQYEFAGHWYALGSGKAPGSLIPFSFRFAHPGTYRVRIVLSGTSVFAAATGPSLKVTVT